MSDWLVRCEYVFIEGAPSIEEVDRLVGGRVDHLGGGVRHALGGDAFRTTLVWTLPSLSAALRARIALAATRGIDHIVLAPTEATRVMSPDDYQIRASDARAGKAVCPNCHEYIPADPANYFAIEGVRAGGEASLLCPRCDFPMSWVILPESE